jgi:anaerobic C4-dicarboxylate transporter
MNSSQEQIIQIPANGTNPMPPEIINPNVLINGGVAILAIFAMAYFSKTLLQSVANLLKVLHEKHK